MLPRILAHKQVTVLLILLEDCKLTHNYDIRDHIWTLLNFFIEIFFRKYGL